MRVRAVVAYDGTDYSGFQRQANSPTVQAALEAALARVTRETITVLAAGRCTRKGAGHRLRYGLAAQGGRPAASVERGPLG